MFGPIGTPELIIIAVVLILLFGVGKISGLGKELGSSIKEFRRAVKDEDKEQDDNVSRTQVQQPAPPPAQPQQQNPQPPAQGQQNPNDAPKSNIF